MKFKQFVLIGLCSLLLAIILPGMIGAEPSTQFAELQLSGNDFAAGSGSGFAVTANGLTIANKEVTSVYLSPELEAPIPFNAVVPSWLSLVPETADMAISLRTRPRGGQWSDWFDIHADTDWMEPGEEREIGSMTAVSAADGAHHYVQFSVSFGRYLTLAAPTLQQFNLTFIDSTAGPTAAEMLEQQRALDAANEPDASTAADAYPRPTVISREIWCTSVDCDYTTGLEYEPATHAVVHHTVSSNSSSDWAAVVRAIWSFHTYPASDSCSSCRGWGDIGYNYLVDRTGVTYEGHLNEDYENLDVVGTHASAANAGSMGVALIGTFTTSEEYGVYDTPPAVMMSSLADLVAWKADQRGIDPYGASRLVNMEWGLSHIMGHRDVYGGLSTLCPGGNAHALLPDLRDDVAARIAFTSPHIYIDELSAAFTKSSANWYEGPRGCGNNGHSFYTWSTTNPAESANWGEWELDVPENGRYLIEAYAPYCNTGASETDGANYTITHADGQDTVVVSHNEEVGLWISLGEFNLLAGGDNRVRLTDLTTTDDGLGVWFDGLRLELQPATATNVTPANGSWRNQQAVDFTWEVTSPTTVVATTFQVATDAEFNDLLVNEQWDTAVTNTSHTFSQEYAALYWRVLLETDLGVQSTSNSTRFGIDLTTPNSAVTAVNDRAFDGVYELFWSGSDNLSGVDAYHVDVRADGEISWTRLLTNTSLTTTEFTPPNPDQTYWFRTQAIDAADNVEDAPTGDGDLSTDDATLIYDPTVTNQIPAATSWIGETAVTFTWSLSEIRDVLTSTIQIATDADFNNLVWTNTISGTTTSVSHTFSQEYAALYWRVDTRFIPPRDGLADTAVSAATRFGIDLTPPTSQIATIYKLHSGHFLVLWSGEDPLSGLDAFNIDYREAGSATWTRWITETTADRQTFTAPDPDLVYEFRSQSIDNVGNEEPLHATADLGTDQAIDLPHAIMLPVIMER